MTHVSVVVFTRLDNDRTSLAGGEAGCDKFHSPYCGSLTLRYSGQASAEGKFASN